MRDWKAALRTWQANNFDRTPQKKTVVAQQYEQRDYSKEQQQERVLPDYKVREIEAMTDEEIMKRYQMTRPAYIGMMTQMYGR